MQRRRQGIAALLSTMSCSRSFTLAPPPLRSTCSTVAAEPSTRTSCGRRCAISYCLNLAPGLHFSQSELCNWRFHPPLDDSIALFIRSPFLFAAPLAPIYPVANHNHCSTHSFMPCLRQRMRCRRGSSRGQSLHQPSMSTSVSNSSSPSSENFSGRYPQTRGGRGRGRELSPSNLGSPHLPVPPLNAPTTHRHTAHLRLPDTLSRPTFIAIISIDLMEEPPGSVAEYTDTGMNVGAATPSADLKHKAPICSEEPSPNPSVSKRGCTEAEKMEEDDPYAYGCRVVEEPPPDSLVKEHGLNFYLYVVGLQRSVMVKKSVEFMPFFISFFLFLNGGIWAASALLTQDVFVGIPNGIGFGLGASQLIMYPIYRKGKPEGEVTQNMLHMDAKY